VSHFKHTEGNHPEGKEDRSAIQLSQDYDFDFDIDQDSEPKESFEIRREIDKIKHDLFTEDHQIDSKNSNYEVVLVEGIQQEAQNEAGLKKASTKVIEVSEEVIADQTVDEGANINVGETDEHLERHKNVETDPEITGLEVIEESNKEISLIKDHEADINQSNQDEIEKSHLNSSQDQSQLNVTIEKEKIENQKKSEDNSNVTQLSKPKLAPAVETKSSPLISKESRIKATEFGFSLDSKKIDETVDSINIENICKCLAHALMKHIAFSKGETLIDDLVTEEEDIPQFSYEFGNELRIDLDEIQQKKEMQQWEAQARNIENYNRVEYMMNHPDEIHNLNHNQPFDYQVAGDEQFLEGK